ncbi:MAG: SCO family protein [Candidatus Thiodiazotropha sp. (ex Cardiolucina cf. quadrata)]|nr:SCO family protein [Candidatus Thiodiazotropha sp. (ex Cardiolucina cf. quadrata)]
MKNNDTPRMGSISLLIALALTAGLLAWYYLATPPIDTQPETLKTQQALLLPELRPLKPFSLSNHQGSKYDNQSLLGHWTFMNFGYTYCPDICPTTMSLFSEMHDQLQAQNAAYPYQITFVSVDPERDTLERLSEYVTYFNPSFIGATGPEAALQQLTKPLGILYERVETEDSAMGYVMDHSASIILVDPQGRFHAYFSPPHDAEKMANDFIAISRHAE